MLINGWKESGGHWMRKRGWVNELESRTQSIVACIKNNNSNQKPSKSFMVINGWTESGGHWMRKKGGSVDGNRGVQWMRK